MDKIERKMESFETMEFTRLKNNLKNNENSVLVLPMHTLLAFLYEKGEAVPKDKRYLFEGFADSVYIDHHFGTDLTVKFQINNLVFAVKL